MLKNKFEVIAVLPLVGGNWEITHIELESVSKDRSIAIMSFVEENAKKYGNHYFMTVDTYAPITFDCTISIIGGLNKPVSCDRFATTYNKWHTMIEDAEKQDNFDALTKTFCRIHNYKSGRAGEMFSFHDPDFGRYRKDPSAPFAENGIFNEPSYYFVKS